MLIEQRFMTEKETAKLTSRSVSTLRNERSRGVGMPYHRIGQRSIRYKLEDVMEWMNSRKIILDR